MFKQLRERLENVCHSPSETIEVLKDMKTVNRITNQHMDALKWFVGINSFADAFFCTESLCMCRDHAFRVITSTTNLLVYNQQRDLYFAIQSLLKTSIYEINQRDRAPIPYILVNFLTGDRTYYRTTAAVSRDYGLEVTRFRKYLAIHDKASVSMEAVLYKSNKVKESLIDDPILEYARIRKGNSILELCDSGVILHKDIDTAVRRAGITKSTMYKHIRNKFKSRRFIGYVEAVSHRQIDWTTLLEEYIDKHRFQDELKRGY